MRKFLSILVILLSSSLMEVSAQEYYTVNIGSAKYSTLYCDQPLNFESFGNNLKAYIISMVFNGSAVLTRCMDARAKTPLVLKATAAGEYNIPIKKATSYYKYLLKGVLEDTEIPSKIGSGKDELWTLVLSVGSNGVGFYPVASETVTIPANKCYLQIKKEYLTQQSNSIDLMEEETDAISDAEYSTTNIGTWYTIQGQRLDQPSSPGIYIHNGKKIIVK